MKTIGDFKSFPHFRSNGFTLVEVVLSLAVVSFALLSLLGLLPMGLATFHNAISATTQALIVQDVASGMQGGDYSKIVATSCYFDSEGGSVSAVDPSRIYKAQITLGALVAPVIFDDPTSCETVSIQITSPGSLTTTTSIIVENNNK